MSEEQKEQGVKKPAEEPVEEKKVEPGKRPTRTITIWGKGKNVELRSEGYETHNSVIVDLQIALGVVSKAMVESSKANIILPYQVPGGGRSN